MKTCPREGGELRSLPQAENYLRPGVTFDTLETIVNQMSDNEFADVPQQRPGKHWNLKIA